MTDTYDAGTADINSLPPITKALRLAWNPAFGTPTIAEAGMQPVPTVDAMRKMLDAIKALEDKQIAHGW